MRELTYEERLNSLPDPWRHAYMPQQPFERVWNYAFGDPEFAIVLAIDRVRKRVLLASSEHRRRWEYISMIRPYRPERKRQSTGRPRGRPRKQTGKG